MGNDRLQAYGIERQEKFQSTFPRGERRLSYEATSRDMSISIHVPSWGTTGSGRIHCQAAGNFNPRSLVGNDYSFQLLRVSLLISIHVPSWGTTLRLIQAFQEKHISIHVPSWGTTLSHSASGAFILFQSTFPRGERRQGSACLIPFSRFQSTFPRGERRQIFTNILCFFMQ